MASWIYSLVRSMAANRGEANQGHPSQVQDNQDQHLQGLRDENQGLRAENRELRARLGMMETFNPEQLAKEVQALKARVRALEAQDELAVASCEEGIWDTLREPNGKYDYMVRYDAPESARIQIEEIQPSGWDDEFDADQPDPKKQQADDEKGDLIENTDFDNPQVQKPKPRTLSKNLRPFTQVRESQKTRNYVKRKPEDFDPIPMSYSDLFDHLVSHNLISIRSVKPIQPPFPRGYDPEAKCKFHSGAVGHSIENCKALKHAVQDLIDSKHLNFNEDHANDFRVKKGGETSAMMNQGKLSQYDPSPASYAELCDFLIGHNVISPRKMKPSQPPFPKGYNPEASCVFHAGAIGHSTEACNAFKQVVRDLVDSAQLTLRQRNIRLSVKAERQGAGVIGSE